MYVDTYNIKAHNRAHTLTHSQIQYRKGGELALLKHLEPVITTTTLNNATLLYVYYVILTYLQLRIS